MSVLIAKHDPVQTLNAADEASCCCVTCQSVYELRRHDTEIVDTCWYRVHVLILISDFLAMTSWLLDCDAVAEQRKDKTAVLRPVVVVFFQNVLSFLHVRLWVAYRHNGMYCTLARHYHSTACAINLQDLELAFLSHRARISHSRFYTRRGARTLDSQTSLL